MEFENIIKMMELIKKQSTFIFNKPSSYEGCCMLDALKEEYIKLYEAVIHPFIYNEDYERDPETGYDTLASEKVYMDNLSHEIFELIA